MWRTSDGETYQFIQNGRQVQFTAQMLGQPIGAGHGEIDGASLRLSMTMAVGGVTMGAVSCDMQAGPEFRSYAGVCQGPNGPFAAQFFR
jgi:hypothetical protein